MNNSNRINVICPKCQKSRMMNASSYGGDLSVQPYVKQCRWCTQKGVPKMSEEARARLREHNLGKKMSEEAKEKISKFRKEHPETWQGYLRPELGPEARRGMHHTKEAKKKISEGVRKAKSKGGDNEQ